MTSISVQPGKKYENYTAPRVPRTGPLHHTMRSEYHQLTTDKQLFPHMTGVVYRPDIDTTEPQLVT
jgi:hypothetical protein